MEIGIVGGSIAGCSAAFLLLKEGHEVTVFERSNKALVGRGGGIGTAPTVINQIKKDGLLQDDFSSFDIHKMPFVGKTPSAEPFGKTAWAMPMNFQVFQWNELWRKLRQQVPNENYRPGSEIVKTQMMSNGKVELVTSDNRKEQFDLVLFADGYNSLGRSILFPEKQLKYRGYILWRGLLPESEMEGTSPLSDEVLRLSYDREPGHNVVYYIPNQNGSTKEGDRVFNWAAYIALSESDLAKVMLDKNGKLRKGTLPPGKMSKFAEKKLKDYLTQHIPAYYAAVVNKTKDSYIQVIYTIDLEAYYKDKICLIGDAGIVVQPFTGSGVFKGYNNVKDLVNCLSTGASVEEALVQWSNIQLKTGKRLLALGEQMENAFIWEQLNFADVDEQTTRNWWAKSISVPDAYNFVKDD